MSDPNPRTPTPPVATEPPPAPGWQLAASDALRYWERRRIAYNAALALVVAAVFGSHWSRFAQVASVDLALVLFLLAVLANVAYCAAYPADLFVQRAGLADAWRRMRWVLLAIGTTFACVLAQFIARGIVGGA